jgi:hypothetical protein
MIWRLKMDFSIYIETTQLWADNEMLLKNDQLFIQLPVLGYCLTIR